MRSAITAVLFASHTRNVKVVSHFADAFGALRPTLSVADAREIEASARTMGVTS